MTNQTRTSFLGVALPGDASQSAPWGADDSVLARAIVEIDAYLAAHLNTPEGSSAHAARIAALESRMAALEARITATNARLAADLGG